MQKLRSKIEVNGNIVENVTKHFLPATAVFTRQSDFRRHGGTSLVI